MKSTRFSFGSAATFLGALLVVVSLSFSLASCKTADDDNPLPQGVEELSADSPLIGKWKDSYGSIYEISQTEFSNYGKSYESYAGNNLVISKSTDNSGYIYIQYTRAADENWNYTTDKTKAPDVGKWYAISFKELTNSSIKLSGAYGEKTSTETLEEAITEFTIENGYFANYSDCTKLSN
ncbi:MAG: hypothetical protein MR932_06255 [Treponema porcinum]|uniref:hypothetical protein n=1 Tax=uncultured Treponema sp. TaxID=162155 RepID=UPI002353FD92|nr:hypothetical protein [uncultured Treponema sp.]MCI7115561.1 hypothetical protein [Treponema porcinum]